MRGCTQKVFFDFCAFLFQALRRKLLRLFSRERCYSDSVFKIVVEKVALDILDTLYLTYR